MVSATVVVGGSVTGGDVLRSPPQPATIATSARRERRCLLTGPEVSQEVFGHAYPSGVSPVAIALLVAALALLAAAEWPRLSRRMGIDRPLRKRSSRRAHLRVVENDDESDEFARSVERDLANLPTIDERDRRTGSPRLANVDSGAQRGGVREDRRDVLHVLALLVVGDLQHELVRALGGADVEVTMRDRGVTTRRRRSQAPTTDRLPSRYRSQRP